PAVRPPARARRPAGARFGDCLLVDDAASVAAGASPATLAASPTSQRSFGWALGPSLEFVTNRSKTQHRRDLHGPRRQGEPLPAAVTQAGQSRPVEHPRLVAADLEDGVGGRAVEEVDAPAIALALE